MKLKVWDKPTRYFHWLLAGSITGAFITSTEANALTYHIYFGELALGLGLFRLGYGFLGNYYARYESFLKGPQAVITYLIALIKLKPPKVVEHNPLATCVFIILILGTISTAVTGLIVLGGQEKIGILAHYISIAQGVLAMEVHLWVAYTLLGFIGLHLLGAITDSYLHKENLVVSLVTGYKEVPVNYLVPPETQRKARSGVKSYIFACSIITLSFMFLWPQTFEAIETQNGFAKKHAPHFDSYKEECADCHFAFPPNLLPARSWEKMMDHLATHFGDDATFDPEDELIVRAYLIQNAAETSDTEWSYYLTQSLSITDTPEKITTLSYWKERHEDIPKEKFKEKQIGSQLNCAACHKYAAYGSFENSHIHIPEPKP